MQFNFYPVERSHEFYNKHLRKKKCTADPLLRYHNIKKYFLQDFHIIIMLKFSDMPGNFDLQRGKNIWVLSSFSEI